MSWTEKVHTQTEEKTVQLSTFFAKECLTPKDNFSIVSMIPAENTPDVFSRGWDLSQSPIAWPTWLAQSIISEIDESQQLWELRMLISINNYCWFTLILIDFTHFTFQCTSIFCHQVPPRFIAFGNSTSCCKSGQGSPWDFRASHCKSLQNYARIPPAKNLVSHRESLQHSQHSLPIFGYQEFWFLSWIPSRFPRRSGMGQSKSSPKDACLSGGKVWTTCAFFCHLLLSTAGHPSCVT